MSRAASAVSVSRFRHRTGDGGWSFAVVAITALALAPIVALGVLAVSGSVDAWPHLIANVLPYALRDTGLLLAGVALVTGTIGVTTAWFVAAHEFRGRRLFEWALLLPLAMPTYIIAYTYAELLDAMGPVQVALRAFAGFESRRDYWFPEPKSLTGAILLFGLVLYPYVYLTVRAVFLMQSSCVLDVARTLGETQRGAFLRVAVPLARPAIAVGVTLALLESLNDLGAVEFFGLRTLTVTIFTVWQNQGDLAAAAQIAMIMLAIVLALIAVERHARREQRFAAQAQRARRLTPRVLRGRAEVIAIAACFVPILLGFLVPALYLAWQASWRLAANGLPPTFLPALVHTLVVATAVAILAVGLGLVMAVAVRVTRTGWLPPVARFSGVGYAVPGTVLAIGLLAPLSLIDNALADAVKAVTGVSPGLILSGSAAALVLALTIRFLAIATGGIEAGLTKISPNLDLAARSLGRTRRETMWRIHAPLVRPALLGAALLVFVDAMKELPATVLLRPFGYETLATLVYGEASRGAFEAGSLAALTMVVAGLGPVILMARLSRLALPTVSERGSAA